jgi:hypothetical protein
MAVWVTDREAITVRLFLMRHGKVETPVMAYQERHLLERGKKETDAAGTFLRMAGEIPDNNTQHPVSKQGNC